jgi:hypothetical protein
MGLLDHLLSLEHPLRLLPQVKIGPLFKALVDYLQEIESTTSLTNRLMAAL